MGRERDAEIGRAAMDPALVRLAEVAAVSAEISDDGAVTVRIDDLTNGALVCQKMTGNLAIHSFKSG